MRRRGVPVPASPAARRAPTDASAGAAGGRRDGLLGIGQALGNQAMGSLLAEGAAGRGRRPRSDLAAGKLDEWLERALRDAGVADPGRRDRLRPRLREAIESGSEDAVAEAIAAADLEPAVGERLETILEEKLAGLAQEH